MSMIELKMSFLFGSLCIEINLWSKKENKFLNLPAIFDTGAHTTHIDKTVLESLGYNLKDSGISYITTVGSHSLKINNTVIGDIKIGHLELGSVLVNFSELSNINFPVILGMNIIKEFNISLNFENNMILMKPNFDTNYKIPVEKFDKNDSRFGMWAIESNK